MPEVTTIGGAIVAVIILIGLYLFYRYRVPKTQDKEAASKFLDSLADAFEGIIVKIVKNLDISGYVSLEDMEADIFEIAYDEIWPFVQKQVAEAVSNKTLSALVGSLITRDNVETLVQLIINKCGVMNLAESKWDEEVAAGIAEAEKFESEVAEKNKSYNNGTVDVSDFNPEDYAEPEPEDLNPQKEEEESLNPDKDDSVEVIGTYEEDIGDYSDELDEE